MRLVLRYQESSCLIPGGRELGEFLTPRNILQQDGAPQLPTCSAPAQARNPRLAVRRRFLPDAAAQTASSGLPGSGTRDIRNCSATHDISDETDRGREENLLPRFPTLAASACDDIRLGPQRFPRRGR